MSLYGKNRDINLFKSINRELIHDYIEQSIGYYKPKLDQLTVNTYGESTNKFWLGPVLINCLIDRGEQNWKSDDFGQDVNRAFRFRFLKDDLINASILSEVGDILLWEDNYYEISGVIENQLIVGKSDEYNYADSTKEFGTSLSVIVTAHWTREEKLGIKQDRL